MKEKVVYVCTSCGGETGKWMGRCPVCGEWNTLEERKAAPAQKSRQTAARQSRSGAAPSRLRDVAVLSEERIITGLAEFNRVMGGGIVRDSMTIMTGPPGGGKSTLALMVANDAAEQGLRVLYASGEESESQIKSRAGRILPGIAENLWIISDESMDAVLEAAVSIDADLLVADSIQTFSLAQYLPARAGNPVQTMECAGELLRLAKGGEKKRAVLVIGQMNKNEQIAGLRALEHLVDTVLVIEGENSEELRTVLTTKNRFGSTGEMGFFTMTEKGMLSVDNPSEYFVTRRERPVTGSALTVVREGTRPVIAEVESLVSRSYQAYPSRTTESLGRDQLSTLISILEERGRMNLSDKNVVVKAAGGLRLREQAANLAVIVSIMSALKGCPIPPDVAFIGDVGLTGELKKVPAMEARVRELDRMGFSRVYLPKNAFPRPITLKRIEVVETETLSQLLGILLKA